MPSRPDPTKRAAALKTNLQTALDNANSTNAVKSEQVPDSKLRGAYKDVFEQINANTTRANALRSGAATRNASEQAALAGYQSGTAEAQRMQDLSAAQANAANVEAQQNLLSAGTDLAQGQSAQDMTLATKLLDLYGANSPELASALTGAMTTGKDVGAAYQSVLSANGGTLPTTTEGEKAYQTAYDYATRAGLSDADAKAYAQGQIQQYVNSSAATAAQTANASAVTRTAASIKAGTSAKSLDNAQVTQAIASDPTVKAAILSQAGTVVKSQNDLFNAVNNGKGNAIINYKGKPIRLTSGWTEYDDDTSVAYAYDYETGETIRLAYEWPN